MHKMLTIVYIIFIMQHTDAQVGFNKPFDIGVASAFSSLEYHDGVLTVYGTILDQNSLPYWDLLFYQVDTLGNALNSKVYVDSIGDDFTGCYPNSFTQLSDNSGFAGVGTFFFRESGYLAIYNNDGTVRRFIEYSDPSIFVAFYIEIMEVSDGFFILGDKQLQDGYSRIFLMKTDKEGNKIWEKRYGLARAKMVIAAL